MRRLEVKERRVQSVLLLVVGFWFGTAGAWMLIDGSLRLNPMSLLVGTACMAMVGFFVWLQRRTAKSVSCFLDDGLVCRNGRRLAWAGLVRVVTQVHDDAIWRIEIHFKNGESAWLIPLSIVNFDEVRALVDELPCEHTKVAV
jgi:hypothetical protein